VKALDTNVVAEMMAASPNPAVVSFLDGLDAPPVLTAITVAEVRFGIRLLPSGERRTRLSGAAERFFAALGEQAVLPFDATCAGEYAAIAADRRRRGRPIGQFDALIASICRVHGADLVTRNVRDFDHVGIQVINPWGD